MQRPFRNVRLFAYFRITGRIYHGANLTSLGQLRKRKHCHPKKPCHQPKELVRSQLYSLPLAYFGFYHHKSRKLAMDSQAPLSPYKVVYFLRTRRIAH
jgi:hypothetical protein